MNGFVGKWNVFWTYFAIKVGFFRISCVLGWLCKISFKLRFQPFLLPSCYALSISLNQWARNTFILKSNGLLILLTGTHAPCSVSSILLFLCLGLTSYFSLSSLFLSLYLSSLTLHVYFSLFHHSSWPSLSSSQFISWLRL